MLSAIASLVLFASSSKSSATTPANASEPAITLDMFFPKKSPRGKTPAGLGWSEDGRYLGYLWNPYDDHGNDLWVYDSESGKSRRLTSIEMFADFDREIPSIIERYKKDKETEEKRKGLSDAERRKLEDEDEQKKKDDKTPRPDYGGVSEFEWAHNSDDLIFTYKGDIYRLKMGEEHPTRLTRTKASESNVKFTKDDKGFYYRLGDGLFRARFDSPVVEQLNPDLPNGLSMGGYSLSPDETKLMVSASKPAKPERTISYISFRGRFAQAMTAPRSVADDPFNEESYLFLYDLNDDPKVNPKNDGKPWQIYYWPSGHEWGETSLAEEPWSADSKKFTFATWKRDARKLTIQVADVDTKKTTPVFEEEHRGGQNSPGMARPFFSPDGSRIYTMLEDSGYRQIWAIDPATQKASQLTKGDFETYPIRISKDGRTIWATADVESTMRNDLYAVSTADGSMTKLTRQAGTYDAALPDKAGDRVALIFRNWSKPTEMYVLNDGKEAQVTESHAPAVMNAFLLKPVPFQFVDRKGFTVHGFLYIPKDYKRSDKRPLWMYTYGGPLGTTKYIVDGQTHSFNLYMTSKHGYITAFIDPRGMSGYGGAFESANWEQPGKPQVEDLTDAVKYLEANYGIDQDKVGINGWSFGGFQTQMCMYTAPDVFKLGIAGAGPTEWQNYNNWYSGGVIGYSELGKPDNLDKYSLTKLAKNLQGPLMLLHGMEDTNVLFQDTIHVYQALLAAEKGPLVELVLDPTGSHGLGGDIKPKEQYAIYEKFLLEHWGSYQRPKR